MRQDFIHSKNIAEKPSKPGAQVVVVKSNQGRSYLRRIDRDFRRQGVGSVCEASCSLQTDSTTLTRDLQGSQSSTSSDQNLNPAASTINLSKTEFRPVNYKTRLCIKWQQGECCFGDRCNFAHGQQELRSSLECNNNGWKPTNVGSHSRGGSGSRKTKLCAKYHLYGMCPFADRCNFAHGTDELMGNHESSGPLSSTIRQNYKTRLCMNWQHEGGCPFGDKCNFAHGIGELRGNGTDSAGLGFHHPHMFFCSMAENAPMSLPVDFPCASMSTYCMPSPILTPLGAMPMRLPPIGLLDPMALNYPDQGQATCLPLPFPMVGPWTGPRWCSYPTPVQMIHQAGIFA